jgi:hypothetical protein
MNRIGMFKEERVDQKLWNFKEVGFKVQVGSLQLRRPFVYAPKWLSEVSAPRWAARVRT